MIAMLIWTFAVASVPPGYTTSPLDESILRVFALGKLGYGEVFLLEEEVPTELKVLLTLSGTLTSLLKHTTEDPAPGWLSRRRIVEMIYFKL